MFSIRLSEAKENRIHIISGRQKQILCDHNIQLK